MGTWPRMRATGSSAGRVLATERGGAIRRLAAVALTASLLVVAGVTASPMLSASAKEDYPTWGDVQKARKSEAATKKEIARIKELVASLKSTVEATQKEAQSKGDEYQEADLDYQEAALRADKLQEQADAAHELADDSIERAGEMAGRLYRSGNTDFSLNLLVNANEADDLLYSYGMASKFSEQAEGVYESALQDKNTAQALTDQADIATDLLEDLKDKAEKAFEESQAAADKAAIALEEQSANKNQLAAQLDVLVDRRQATEKDYEKGVRAAQRAAVDRDAGDVSSDGWTKPGYGSITSPFGYRVNPFGGGGSTYHLGTDIGVGCGGAIYAAHGGTVVYSGWYGVYGNFIRIDNGDGTTTEYGHIQNGGLLVRQGDKVGAGKHIARAGATGGATGCHLHYGVRINGLVTDPVPFMRKHGITLG